MPLRKRRRVRTIAILPTLITMGNAVCGFLALKEVAMGWNDVSAHNHFQNAALLILLAMIFDALDGKVARMTKTASSFGTQLDSLCDFLTFGVAPAFLMYGVCHPAVGRVVPFEERVVLVVSIFYACCAVTRLARFNVETGTDEKFHLSFSGLPSPAAAGVVASILLPWGALTDWPIIQGYAQILRNGLPVIVFILGVLMVSRAPYPHIVNRLFRGVRPFVTLIELAVVALLGVIFHEFALFIAFFGYAIAGPLLWAKMRIFKKPGPAPVRGAEPPGGDPLF